ncbi:DUF6572 domain-containing protein [Psychrobacillus sp. NPDC093180]|uniref:DUF6572 domain-containing protein n=1 Tax=Psychrobacillus sp. NPDC093180 TaxID=3364489 RepID=UPI0037F97B4A
MSIIETDKIDALGISKDGKGLKLMLADHLDWENEIKHLTLLQDKINAYLGFIEMKQYADIYPGVTFKYYVIDVRFKYETPESCSNFFAVINPQLSEYKIRVLKNED